MKLGRKETEKVQRNWETHECRGRKWKGKEDNEKRREGKENKQVGIRKRKRRWTDEDTEIKKTHNKTPL